MTDWTFLGIGLMLSLFQRVGGSLGYGQYIDDILLINSCLTLAHHATVDAPCCSLCEGQGQPDQSFEADPTF